MEYIFFTNIMSNDGIENTKPRLNDTLVLEELYSI